MPGVKDLLARFEQKGENSPPEKDIRGRSPGPAGLSVASAGTPTPSHSPRPLSKVRTSFVTVEKDGRIGLRRDPSTESVSVSSRRFSNDTDRTTPGPISEKNEFFADTMAKTSTPFKTNLAKEPIPESPRQADTPKNGFQTPDIVPGPNPDKITDEEETKTKLTPADPTIIAATEPNGIATNGGLNGSSGLKDKLKSSSPATSRLTPKATPINTTLKTTSKPARSPLKSPLASKPLKSPAKETAKATSLGSDKRSTAAVPKESTPKKTAVSKASASSPAKKPSALDLSPSSTGFVKPKPKSPTRPVRLPASLTTHTAASASKHGSAAPPPRNSVSRASGNVNRPASRVSISTAGVTTTAPKGLRRQSSTINRPRPSIGPPPKLMAKDHPVVKKDRDVDEGFLARMMRPTQSSSSKTAEKTPITPPRKQSVPTANAAVRKPVSEDAKVSAQKAVAKMAESVKPKASSRDLKAGVVASKPAPKEDEVIPKASIQDEAKPLLHSQPTARDVAPVVAQAESAEEAIAEAVLSTETAVTPIVEKSGVVAAPSPQPSEISEPGAEPEVKVTNGNHTEENEDGNVMCLPVITDGPKAENIEELIEKTSALELESNSATLAEPDAEKQEPSAPAADLSKEIDLPESEQQESVSDEDSTETA